MADTEVGLSRAAGWVFRCHRCDVTDVGLDEAEAQRREARHQHYPIGSGMDFDEAWQETAGAAGWVPLAEVLDALRDHDGFVQWQRQGPLNEYVMRKDRDACARYLAERFAPTAPRSEPS